MGSSIRDVLAKTDFLTPPPPCPISPFGRPSPPSPDVPPVSHKKRPKRNLFCDPVDSGRGGGGVILVQTQNICSKSSETNILFRGRPDPPPIRPDVFDGWPLSLILWIHVLLFNQKTSYSLNQIYSFIFRNAHVTLVKHTCLVSFLH